MPVIIKKIKDKIDTAVIEALNELNYQPKKEPILIKPNIVNLFPPGSPFITNVKVVAGIIHYLKNIGRKEIIVAEGTIHPDPQLTFDASGFTEMCQKENVQLIDLNKAERIEVPWSRGALLLPKIVMESEFINVPKLKTHNQTIVTLGLKNTKGILRLVDKRKFHISNLNESIANLAKIVPTSLCVIDAITGVEGNGPGAMGKVVPNLNLIIAGTNILSTDIVATKVMGIDLEKIKHLSMAKKMKFFPEDEKILGEKIEDVQRKFELPTDFHKLFNLYCWWEESTCSACSGLLGDLKKHAMKNPYYLWRLFIYGFLKRLDIITGDFESPPPNHGKVICLGSCSKELAEKNGFIYIEGCPPDPDKVLKKI